MWLAFWSGKVQAWFETEHTYVIGRDEARADIIIKDDASISREHTTIRFSSRQPDEVGNPYPTQVVVQDKSKYGTAVFIPKGPNVAAAAAMEDITGNNGQNSVMMALESEHFSFQTGANTIGGNNNTATDGSGGELCKLETGQEWNVPAGTKIFTLRLGKHGACIDFEWAPWVFPVAGDSRSAADVMTLNQAACAAGATLIRPSHNMPAEAVAAMLDKSATQAIVTPTQALHPSPLVFAALCAAKPIVGMHVFVDFRGRASCRDAPPDLRALSSLPGHIDPQWHMLMSAASKGAKQQLLLSGNSSAGGPSDNNNRVSSMLAGGSSSMLLLSAADGSITVQRDAFAPNEARRDLFSGLTFVTIQRTVEQQMSFFVPRSRGRTVVLNDPLPVMTTTGKGSSSSQQLTAWFSRHEGHLLVVQSDMGQEQQQQQQPASPDGQQQHGELPDFFLKQRAAFASKIPVVEFTDILCSIVEARRVFDTNVAPLPRNAARPGFLREDADVTDDSSTAVSTANASPQKSPRKNAKSGQQQQQQQQPSLGGGGMRRGRVDDNINNRQKVIRPLGKEDDLVGDEEDEKQQQQQQPSLLANNQNSSRMVMQTSSVGTLINMDEYKVESMMGANNSNLGDEDDDDAGLVIGGGGGGASSQQQQRGLQQDGQQQLLQQDVDQSAFPSSQIADRDAFKRNMLPMSTFLPSSRLDEDGADDSSSSKKKKKNLDRGDIFAAVTPALATLGKTARGKEEKMTAKLAPVKKEEEEDDDDDELDELDEDNDAAGDNGGGQVLIEKHLIVDPKRSALSRLSHLPCFWGLGGNPNQQQQQQQQPLNNNNPGQKKFRKQRLIASNEPFEQMEALSGLQRLDPMGAAGFGAPGRSNRGGAALMSSDRRIARVDADFDDLIQEDPDNHRPRTFAAFDDDAPIGAVKRTTGTRGGKKSVADAPPAKAKKAAAKKQAPKKKTKKKSDDSSSDGSFDDSDDDADDSSSSSEDESSDDSVDAPPKPAAKKAPAKRGAGKKAAVKAASPPSQQPAARGAKVTSIFDVDSLFD